MRTEWSAPPSMCHQHKRRLPPPLSDLGYRRAWFPHWPVDQQERSSGGEKYDRIMAAWKYLRRKTAYRSARTHYKISIYTDMYIIFFKLLYCKLEYTTNLVHCMYIFSQLKNARSSRKLMIRILLSLGLHPPSERVILAHFQFAEDETMNSVLYYLWSKASWWPVITVKHLFWCAPWLTLSTGGWKNSIILLIIF